MVVIVLGVMEIVQISDKRQYTKRLHVFNASFVKALQNYKIYLRFKVDDNSI